MSSVDLYGNRNELRKLKNQKALITRGILCAVLLSVTPLTRCDAIFSVTKNPKDRQILIFGFDAGQSIDVGLNARTVSLPVSSSRASQNHLQEHV
ncbi:hypothetical protein K6V72_09505 [Ralstonia insidiosa]|uniref:Uncharacterized protein n=1 Tax=Ralstonia insidiosa TaxID=190721 RepID=A0A192A124_9RALS|nr:MULTISPECIES: hypothetical protein [Ralstonia]ANH73450.1 hypothetical protein ACS15_3584 [Ralstonia insidiosa]ANJ74038.1 hypothetical protein A9Y76_16975 [Ralstonia insidiosa]EPX95551.1 hypothetical protein C404_24525 [Ralstonia sp. AU12-08]KAB0471250.1 hypothetical protein F7R11_01210 [Ralstonia insidiosa]MBY4707444.1 hypothetical protein [Ralstonia insidiosa]